jgi:hypothetical protein
MDTVYLALVHGPTIGAPKARVLLVLEGSRWIYGASGKIPRRKFYYLSRAVIMKITAVTMEMRRRTTRHMKIIMQDTLADSTSDVGDGDAEETEESRTQLGFHFKGRSVSRTRNFGLWELVELC